MFIQHLTPNKYRMSEVTHKTHKNSTHSILVVETLSIFDSILATSFSLIRCVF